MVLLKKRVIAQLHNVARKSRREFDIEWAHHLAVGGSDTEEKRELHERATTILKYLAWDQFNSVTGVMCRAKFSFERKLERDQEHREHVRGREYRYDQYCVQKRGDREREEEDEREQLERAREYELWHQLRDDEEENEQRERKRENELWLQQRIEESDDEMLELELELEQEQRRWRTEHIRKQPDRKCKRKRGEP